MYVETVIYPKQPFLSLLSQVPYMGFPCCSRVNCIAESAFRSYTNLGGHKKLTGMPSSLTTHVSSTGTITEYSLLVSTLLLERAQKECSIILI